MNKYLYPDNELFIATPQQNLVHFDEISDNIRFQSQISSIKDINLTSAIRALFLFSISSLILFAVMSTWSVFFVQMLDFQLWSIVQFLLIFIFVVIPGLFVTYIGYMSSLHLLREPRNFDMKRDAKRLIVYRQFMVGTVTDVKTGRRNIIYFQCKTKQDEIHGKFTTASKVKLEKGDTVNVIYNDSHYAIL